MVFYVQLKCVVEIERLVRKWFETLGALKAPEMILMLFEERDLLFIAKRRLASPTASAVDGGNLRQSISGLVSHLRVKLERTCGHEKCN